MVWFFLFCVVVVVLLIYVAVKLGKSDEMKPDELLRFFNSDENEEERLSIKELSDRIIERTEGRRDLSDEDLYTKCDTLVSEGKLFTAQEETVVGSMTLRKKVYYRSPKGGQTLLESSK